MDVTDYEMLAQLSHMAEVALDKGELDGWQAANASTFHALARAIVDLNSRLARLEPSPNQSLVFK